MTKRKTVRVGPWTFRFCNNYDQWRMEGDGSYYVVTRGEPIECLLRSLLRARARIAYLEEAYVGKRRRRK